MYSGRLRSSSRRRSNSPDSAPNKSRYKKTRDASMHSRSSSRESCPDMDVDKKPTYDKTNFYNIIEERKSEDSEEVKKENIEDISEPKSILSDESNSSSSEDSLDKDEKKIQTLKNKSLASEKVSPRLSHKEIKQKWQELYRAGLSETDVIKKNIED